jgi:hypothetical protein
MHFYFFPETLLPFAILVVGLWPLALGHSYSLA